MIFKMNNKKNKPRLKRIVDGWPQYRATENTPWHKHNTPYLALRLKWDLSFDLHERLNKLESAFIELKTSQTN